MPPYEYSSVLRHSPSGFHLIRRLRRHLLLGEKAFGVPAKERDLSRSFAYFHGIYIMGGDFCARVK